jgi:hypothetical protein
MGHHEERERTAEEAAAERLEHEHPAKPTQPGDEGYEQGYDQHRDTPEEELEPNYARGIAREDVPGTERHGRFSEGQEELPPETPEKVVERRFSEGVERDPTST